MSFGRPPSFSSLTATPPDRGAFPLDHDGECRDQMMAYMKCLRQNSSNSTPCRPEGKTYLDCRMSRGLMERDDWKNLGMDKVQDTSTVSQKSENEGSGSKTAQKK